MVNLIISCNQDIDKSSYVEKNDLKLVTNILPDKTNLELEKNDVDINKTEINYCELIKVNNFSNLNNKDTFKLIYNCDSLEDTMIFQIIGFTGDKLYEERFFGTSFYDYSRPWYIYVTDYKKRGRNFDPETLSAQISDSLHQADLQFIKQKMNDFFIDTKFVINPLSKLDKSMFFEKNYNKISDDTTLIGFSYKLFEGGGFEMIAYSKKFKETVIIASSD